MLCVPMKQHPHGPRTKQGPKIVRYVLTQQCSEKTKSFNLKIPQPDSERRQSPDFRAVFEIMIGPFSFCKIGKT